MRTADLVPWLRPPVLRALSGDLPDLVFDADNPTMVLGVAVFAGDGV